MVCVRSLVPKQKNSATSAISIGEQRGARQLDHRADEVFKFYFRCGDDFFGDAARGGVENLKFFFVEDERNHDLRKNFNSAPLAIDRGFDDGANLHLEDFWIGDRQAAASMAEHGIGFVELLDAADYNFNFYSNFLG